MKTINLVLAERFGIIRLLNEKYQKGGLDLGGIHKAMNINEKITIKGTLGFDKGGQVKQTEEYKAFDIKQIFAKDGQSSITWDSTKDKGVDAEFSEDEFKLIKELLQTKSDSKEFGMADNYAITLAKKLGIEG